MNSQIIMVGMLILMIVLLFIILILYISLRLSKRNYNGLNVKYGKILTQRNTLAEQNQRAASMLFESNRELNALKSKIKRGKK